VRFIARGDIADLKLIGADGDCVKTQRDGVVAIDETGANASPVGLVAALRDEKNGLDVLDFFLHDQSPLLLANRWTQNPDLLGFSVLVGISARCAPTVAPPNSRGIWGMASGGRHLKSVRWGLLRDELEGKSGWFFYEVAVRHPKVAAASLDTKMPKVEAVLLWPDFAISPMPTIHALMRSEPANAGAWLSRRT
jgi:hypothetical protein